MAIWYEVEKTEKGLDDFLESNWAFHDFRPERVEYVPSKDMVEIFLRYDTRKEGVLLRFAWIHSMGVNTKRDYEAEWLNGSVALLLDNHTIIWPEARRLHKDGTGTPHQTSRRGRNPREGEPDVAVLRMPFKDSR